MDNKICIDKRIWYLILFVVPLFFVILSFSLFVNSQRIYQNSIASEYSTPQIKVKQTSLNPSPITVKTLAICLKAIENKTAQAIDLYLIPSSSPYREQPMKIYANSSYMALISPPISLNTKLPFYSLKRELFSKEEAYIFFAIQGQGETNTQKKETLKNCEKLFLD